MADKATVLAYMESNPQATCKEAAILFGCNPQTVGVWLHRSNKGKIPTIPRPVATLPPDLVALAQQAMANALQHLANPSSLKGASLKDIAMVVTAMANLPAVWKESSNPEGDANTLASILQAASVQRTAS